MSVKRNSSSLGGGRSHSGGASDSSGKVDRQGLYDELKRLASNGQTFSATDVALIIGAAEGPIARTLIGLAAEGFLEKTDAGKYKAVGFTDVPQAEFLKAVTRASKSDTVRQRDMSEITRLKQNNDIMRGKLLAAISERDHYLAALRKHGIDPGPTPIPVAANAAASAGNASVGPPPSGAVDLPGEQESSTLPSGPGVAAGSPSDGSGSKAGE